MYSLHKCDGQVVDMHAKIIEYCRLLNILSEKPLPLPAGSPAKQAGSAWQHRQNDAKRHADQDKRNAAIRHELTRQRFAYKMAWEELVKNKAKLAHVTGQLAAVEQLQTQGSSAKPPGAGEVRWEGTAVAATGQSAVHFEHEYV